MSTVTLEQEFSATDAGALTGATPRQIDYWSRVGYLGEHLLGRGSGTRRRFTVADVELLDAIRQLHDVDMMIAGPVTAASRNRQRAFDVARRVVRARPVAPEGELLVVTLDPPRAQRWDHVCIELGGPPAWVVPLRSFSTPALPVSEGVDVLTGRTPTSAGTGSGGVEPDPSHTGFPRLGGSTHEGGA